jgi:DNA polymerase-3 subunit beta
MEDREVELKFKDELSPVIMKAAAEDDFLAVIMPMRL